MASVKVKFRPSTLADQEDAIYYQIVHDRKVRQLLSSYTVFPNEWSDIRSTVILRAGNPRNGLLAEIRDRINCDVEQLLRIDRKFYNTREEYTADDIIEEFNRYVYEYTLFKFMESEIIRLRGRGKARTSETYRSTLRSFRKFRKDEDIRLDAFTPEVTEAYEAWLMARNVVPNTISFYMRILRAAYNRAVEQEIIKDGHPFKTVYTGVDKTVKRALPLPVIKKIKCMDLARFPTMEYARDMFILSFCLRGMSFVDMAFLRKSDLKNGFVTYRRRKTGQILTIAWTVEMQQIIDRYGENPTEYLLPILRRRYHNEIAAYHNISYRINRGLRKIAQIVGIEIPLTLYVARHSWASAAKSKGIPLPVISEGLGHESESTTRIYLADLDTSVVDRANAIILRSIAD